MRAFDKNNFLRTLSRVCACLLLSTTLAAAADARNTTYQLDIPAQALNDALQALALASQHKLFYDAALVKGKSSPALKGTFTAEQAVQRLLSGTNLSYEVTDDGLVLIQPPSAPASSTTSSRSADVGRLQLAQASSPAPAQGERARSADEDKTAAATVTQAAQDAAKNPERQQVEEIIVTGTHIRGMAPVGSPLITIDREEIILSGFGGTGDLLRALPQNFGGDTNEFSRRTTSGGDSNNSGGFGANLRGLGVGATLVLLNGRRLPQAGGFTGGYVDISRIPLSAIERVEVLTDGASAIYGSDAIAGVVNFVLRKQYDGFETSFRAGTVGEGGRDEYRLAQTAGKTWSTGNVLLSYQYEYKDHLLLTEREFTASQDLRRFGGSDWRTNTGSPETITTPSLAAIPRNQDGTGLTRADLLLGQQNLDDEANAGLDLLPQRKTHNVFLALRQEITHGLELFGEFSAASEKTSVGTGPIRATGIRVSNTHPHYVSPSATGSQIRVAYNFINELGLRQLESDTLSYGGVAGIAVDLRGDWRTEVTASYGREKNESEGLNLDTARLAETLGFDDPATPFNPAVHGYFNIFGDGNQTSREVLDFIRSSGQSFTAVAGDVVTANWGASGTLIELPAAPVKLAVEAEYREESYELRSGTVVQGVRPAIRPQHRDRNVKSVFGEIVLPIVGNANSIPGVEELRVGVAGRYSDYSDVGSSFDPKIGTVWTPFTGLSVRGTWGTSFKAPKLHSLIPSTTLNSVAADFPDPAASDGLTAALYIEGNNPDLVPETSTAWTAGLDIKPARWPGLTTSVTYYDIHFKDRIGRIPSTNRFGVFLEPALAPVIDRSPSAELVAAYLRSRGLINITGRSLDVADIEATVDARITNLSISDTAGLDVNLHYQIPSRLGQWSFGLNANKIFHLREQLTKTSAAAELLGRVGGPARSKWRASVGLTGDAAGAFVYVNHVADYEDSQPAGMRPVDSWTTVDLALRCTPRLSGWLSDVIATLNIRNLLDEAPPFVDGFGGVGYDATNADPIGRFVSIEVRRKW